MNQSTNTPWVILGILALVVLVAVGAVSKSGNSAETVEITIASSSTKKEWLNDSVSLFNKASRSEARLQIDGKAIRVEVLEEEIEPGKFDHYRSGTMVTDILSGKIRPVVASPAEESWLDKLGRDWGDSHSSTLISARPVALVRTPLVIAMWQSRATALGCWPLATPDCTWKRLSELASSSEGWASIGHEEWGKLKFGYGYVGESNSGTLTAVMLCMTGAGKIAGLESSDVTELNGCGQTIKSVEQAKVHSGRKSSWLLDWMLTGGPEYLDAVTTYEQDVIEFNKHNSDKLREPLVAAYPQDGTVVVEHPFAILDGADWVTPEQTRAAALLLEFLLSEPRQTALGEVGLRPADPAKKPLSIETRYGANPDALLLPVILPDVVTLELIREVWHKNKKHSVLALVFDKSASMEGEKMTTALAGAKAFVDAMDPDDYFIWIPFDQRVYTGTEGLKSEIGEKLTGDISGTVASGGTALYDAIAQGYQSIEQIRKTSGDTVRYGIVVLSDGVDTSSKAGKVGLQELLTRSEGDPTAIQIHTIGIGSDADKATLRRISGSAHGAYWDAENPELAVEAYRQIAVHY